MHVLEQLLQNELEPVASRYREHRLVRRTTRTWAVIALGTILVLLLCVFTDWRWPWAVPVLAGGALFSVSLLRRRWRREPIDIAAIVEDIEREHPRLHTLLLTAVEQHPDRSSGELHYLQQRVIEDALAYNELHPWGHRSFEHLFFARCAQRGALALFLLALAGLYLLAPLGPSPLPAPPPAVSVTPGDTDLERGQSLVVLARFARGAPTEAALVVTPANGTATRIPLTRNMDDPVFGGSIPAIRDDLNYRVEYGNNQTADFQVTVFDYPRLERADARLVYPAYTRLEPKTIEDTRRVTAVEGTRLEYVLQFNKPVDSAHWLARDFPPLATQADPDIPTSHRLSLTLEESRRYSLLLQDDAGRTNRAPAEFVIEVFTNQTPGLQLVSPRGDDQASPLEEIAFRAQVTDDFGLDRFGLAYQLSGAETRFIELGGQGGPNEKHELQHLLDLEALKARTGQLLSYYLWADDVGPDGDIRRTFSDMYFIEVRPFDEIFRENQSGEGQGQGAGQQANNPAEELTELQKQIIAATWRLQRQSRSRPNDNISEDASIIRESQEHALDQVLQLAERASNPSSSAFLEAAESEMRRAVERLDSAADASSAESLPDALAAEQGAYEALLQLQAHEYQVARGQQGGGGGGGGGRSQRQLDQLQLKDAADRYETQRQATSTQTEEQRQELQFLSRLRELAQRQHDLNEQLKELQLALQEAQSDEDREELLRRLKRLREEQRQMLADVDELQQRMEQQGQRAQNADASQQLEQTRSDLQRASEAMEQGAVSDAVAAGTRASRQLEQLREDIRARDSSQFAEDMRRMRQDARQLAESQQKLAQEIENLSESSRPSLSDSNRREDLAERLAHQTGALTSLLDHLRQVSQESESAEPLLSRQLHETFRQIRQSDAANPRELLQDLLRQGALTRPVYDLLREPDQTDPGQSLQLTERFLREGHLTAAQQLEEKARHDLETLRRNIDLAADSILGDDTDALRLARAELDELLGDLESEIARAQNSTTNSTAQTTNLNGGPSSPGSQSQSQGDPSESEQTAQTAAGDPNSEGSPGSQGESSGDQLAQSESQAGGSQTTGEGQSNQQGQPASQAGGQPGPSPSGETPRDGSQPRSPGQSPTGGAPRFFDIAGGTETGGGGTSAPLTGTGYGEWSDRLAQVEEMLELTDLRAEVSRVRDRARAARTDFTRHGKEPQWDLVQIEMAGPLAEVRHRLTQELARRQTPDALVPIDRDPVPPRYAEIVRRYYERLGNDDP